MKTIRIRGGKENTNAVKVLTAHLEGLGHKVVRTPEEAHDVGFSWGCSYLGPKPFLNSEVNAFNKFESFEEFKKAGILCPITLSCKPELGPGEWPNIRPSPLEPWLARKIHHAKGKDIVVCQSPREILQVYYAQKHDFFSLFIPTETEYRVWVFKGKAFAVYEKQYQGEGEYQGYMRNMRFGFEFQKRDDLRATEAITVPCVKAVKALGMDFGAVDLLKGKDGKYYVLEVNSAPAIEHEKRNSGIRLAHRISKWAEQQ